jgi:dephospho-CoA kinase
MEKKIKTIIGIAGTQGSGKGTATAFFVEKFRAKHFRFSGILDQILSVLDLPISRENEQELAVLLRENFGEDVLAHALFESVKKSNADVIVIDGFRKVSEIEKIKKLGNFKMIFLRATPEVAYQRMVNRGEKHEEHLKTFEEFQASGSHVSDKDVNGLEQYSDFVIENNGTLEELQAQLTSAFTKAL